MSHLVLAAATLVLMLALGTPAAAQPAYPARPIEVIIPFPPGGPADTAARIIQPKLSAALGVPLVLVNKSGGGGALAADYVGKSKPHGYTVFAATNAPVTIVAATQPDISYRPPHFAANGASSTDLSGLLREAGEPRETLQAVV